MILFLLLKSQDTKQKVDYDQLINQLSSNFKDTISQLDDLTDTQLQIRLILEGQKDLEERIYQQVQRELVDSHFLTEVFKQAIAGETELKKQAIRLFLKIKTPQAIDYVIPFLYDQRDEINRLVIDELAQVNRSKVVTALVGYLDYCDDVAIQQKLRAAFYDLGELCVPQLLELIDSDSQHLTWIIKLLGELGDERVIDPLLELLNNHPQPNIRVNAAQSLGNFIDVTSVFNGLVSGLQDEDCQVRAQIVKLLGQLEHPKLLPYFYHMLGDSSGIVRSKAAQVLFQAGEKGIKYLILAAEEEEQPEVISCLEQVDTVQLISLVKEGYETGNIAEDSSLLRVVDEATEEDEELTEGVII